MFAVIDLVVPLYFPDVDRIREHVHDYLLVEQLAAVHLPPPGFILWGSVSVFIKVLLDLASGTFLFANLESLPDDLGLPVVDNQNALVIRVQVIAHDPTAIP
ncbi:MAG: hypothetical protein ABIJ95_06745 [Pseudomonadota bacterium]